MKYLKLFEELNIIGEKDFPENENYLSNREHRILNTLVGGRFISEFDIRKDDNYYYVRLYLKSMTGFGAELRRRWIETVEPIYEFDKFEELKNYLCLRKFLRDESIEKLNNLLNKIDRNLFDGHLLYYACQDGKVESVKFLLDNTDIDPSWHGNACSIVASHKRYTEIVYMLLKKLGPDHPPVQTELRIPNRV